MSHEHALAFLDNGSDSIVYILAVVGVARTRASPIGSSSGRALARPSLHYTWIACLCSVGFSRSQPAQIELFVPMVR